MQGKDAPTRPSLLIPLSFWLQRAGNRGHCTSDGRRSHWSIMAEALHRPRERSFFFAGTCSSRALLFFGQKRRLVLVFVPAAQKPSIAVAAPHRSIIAGAPPPCARLRCKERAAPRNAKKKGPCHLARALKNGQRESRHLPIFPGRLQPSIFGTTELNFCVRNGNRWDLRVIGTGRYAKHSAFAYLF